MDKYWQFHVVQSNICEQRVNDSPGCMVWVRGCTGDSHSMPGVCVRMCMCMSVRQPHLGHWSLGVTLPARLSSGTSVGSPGLLLLRAALSRTCCSSTARRVGSGGMGFMGPSPGDGSSTSSSGFSSAACFFFFFLALCWVRGNLMSDGNVRISLKSTVFRVRQIWMQTQLPLR